MTNEWRGWRDATERALYGPDGFYSRAHGPGPAGHFRTSVHVSPLFAQAVAGLLRHVDAALGHPSELALVDVGAGRGELLAGVLAALPDDVTARLRPYAVERAPRPAGLDPRVTWLPELPAAASLTGLLFANEWLDNVPVDVVETDAAGVARRVLVGPDGTERLGDPVCGPDADWLARWWPLPTRDESKAPGGTEGREEGEAPRSPGEPDAAEPSEGHQLGAGAACPVPGLRAEIGRPRDAAWSRAVRVLRAGLAVTADYAHDRATRPPYGSLTGFREGREVRPIPDGTCDITAHVALDALIPRAPAGSPPARLLTQRDALRALGVDGRRPPLSLASSDPAGYVRALGAAGAAAELIDPAGLGGFRWLVQPVGGACAGVLGEG
ncbi:SAM-dependent methyltransferase [Streptomyces sp. NPDC003077]|uniref:SAM-dependent methyltransferase n=1 Tax=Streptomyces sp. NPDC003077 TaxID=3154443 RepID=UPI0033B9C3A0